MLALFTGKKHDVRGVFETALAASRNPALYSGFGVPDTFDGRFDCLLLHLWPVFKGLEAQDKAAQALYDLCFKRMELALRETGTGDLAVGRQVRAMMKAFYGRLVTYNACKSADELRAALARNLYGTLESDIVPSEMIEYVQKLGQMTVLLDETGPSQVIYPSL